MKLKEKRMEKLNMDPINLPGELYGTNQSMAEDIAYRRVFALGKFDHGQEIYLGPRPPLKDPDEAKSPADIGVKGYLLFTPFTRTDGSRVLVNRGWISAERKESASKTESNDEGIVALSGVVIPVDIEKNKPAFVPESIPEERMFYWKDIYGMAKLSGITETPILIDAINTEPPSNGIQTHYLDSYLHFSIEPDGHLVYAATWWVSLNLLYCLQF